MTTLEELVDNSRTDKNNVHSYLPLYEQLLSRMKMTAKNVLEVGIGYAKCHNGGSIKLWADYFENATVYAADIIDYDEVYDGIKNNQRINIFASSDAYDPQFVENTFIVPDVKFDMVLDDGPHTLESMKAFIQLYSPLLTENGILIIEDVQMTAWFEELKSVVSPDLLSYVTTYDLRYIKNRYDDLVFVIDKKNC
uniref:Methyltransferase n=1 Tax=viral metagenome TaxID=1070528 RepID=A0A6C0LLQ1_9ZZZZ